VWPRFYLYFRVRLLYLLVGDGSQNDGGLSSPGCHTPLALDIYRLKFKYGYTRVTHVLLSRCQLLGENLSDPGIQVVP